MWSSHAKPPQQLSVVCLSFHPSQVFPAESRWWVVGFSYIRDVGPPSLKMLFCTVLYGIIWSETPRNLNLFRALGQRLCCQSDLPDCKMAREILVSTEHSFKLIKLLGMRNEMFLNVSKYCSFVPLLRSLNNMNWMIKIFTQRHVFPSVLVPCPARLVSQHPVHLSVQLANAWHGAGYRLPAPRVPALPAKAVLDNKKEPNCPQPSNPTPNRVPAFAKTHTI